MDAARELAVMLSFGTKAISLVTGEKYLLSNNRFVFFILNNASAVSSPVMRGECIVNEANILANISSWHISSRVQSINLQIVFRTRAVKKVMCEHNVRMTDEHIKKKKNCSLTFHLENFSTFYINLAAGRFSESRTYLPG